MVADMQDITIYEMVKIYMRWITWLCYLSVLYILLYDCKYWIHLIALFPVSYKVGIAGDENVMECDLKCDWYLHFIWKYNGEIMLILSIIFIMDKPVEINLKLKFKIITWKYKIASGRSTKDIFPVLEMLYAY